MYWLFLAVTAACAFLQMLSFEVFSERQAPRIRTAYLRAILRQDSAWFDSLEHGAMELPGSIAADAMVLKDGMGFKLSQAIQCITVFVISFIAAYIWGWQLAATAESRHQHLLGAATGGATPAENVVKERMLYSSVYFSLRSCSPSLALCVVIKAHCCLRKYARVRS